MKYMMNLIKYLGVINGRHKGIYECSECKEHVERMASHVKASKTSLCKSCIMKNTMTKHGDFGTRLYSIWSNMIQRCTNKKNKEFKWYGGNGVTIFDEWFKYENFRNWSLQNGYSEDLVLDKDILCDELKIYPKIYSPSTCMWITSLENRDYSMKEYAKKVSQYNLDGTFVATYKSHNEASKQTGLSQSNISAVVRGDRKQTGGYLWK